MCGKADLPEIVSIDSFALEILESSALSSAKSSGQGVRLADWSMGD